MYGVGMGNLTVYIKTDDGQLHQIWRKSGNQNQGWKMDMIGDLDPSVPYQVVCLHLMTLINKHFSE